MSKTQKAIVTEIEYAGLSFEGLMLPNGKYAIAFTQARELFLVKSVLPKNATRAIKALLPKDLSFSKIPTEMNSRPVWVLELNQISQLVLSLAFTGNEVAQKFAMASVSEKLERVFDSAFGVIVEERERELRFAARLSSKATFRPLTDLLKENGYDRDHIDPKKRYQTFIWEFQTALGIKSGTRDEINADELMRLVSVQSRLIGLIEAKVDPWDALEATIQSIAEGKI